MQAVLCMCTHFPNLTHTQPLRTYIHTFLEKPLTTCIQGQQTCEQIFSQFHTFLTFFTCITMDNITARGKCKSRTSMDSHCMHMLRFMEGRNFFSLNTQYIANKTSHRHNLYKMAYFLTYIAPPLSNFFTSGTLKFYGLQSQKCAKHPSQAKNTLNDTLCYLAHNQHLSE